MTVTSEAFAPIWERIMTANGLLAYLSHADAFRLLTERLLTVNEQMNLTAIRTVEGTVALHIADSLLGADFLPEQGKILDVGCGAGFPSLPFAIVRPDLAVAGMDSTEKKLGFVAETARVLGLSGYCTYCGRAEEAAKPPMREGFDLCCARAVARLNLLSELCLPFVKVGGRALFLKGAAGQDELDEAKEGIRALGGGDIQILHKVLHTDAGDEQRTLIVVEKIARTPMQFPRRYAQMLKKPL